jgi:hypothetical protein
MGNPFLTAIEARCWINMGDRNARAALQFADAARANWARAKELLDQAEREQRDLAEQIAARRKARSEDARVWTRIQGQIEERDERVGGQS